MDERSKKNIEDYVKLNKFLNERTNRFGENIVDIVMDYVEELEEKNKILADNLLQQIELTQGRVKKLADEKERYKEVLEGIAKEVYLEGDPNIVTQNKLIRVIINARQGLRGETK